MKIIAKPDDPTLVARLSESLTEGGELVLGGLAEGSDCPGNSYMMACVYRLIWSKDRSAFGLEVETYESMGSDDCNEEEDPYFWALDNLQSTSEVGAVALLEADETADTDDLSQQLQDAYVDSGGVCITDPRCP